MGETKFQKIVFTLLMCAFMVLGMTVYNMLLNEGLSEHFLLHLLKDILPVFAIALCLDVFMVGPLAKGFVFNVLKPGKNAKPIKIILMIATSMVTCMVLCRSVYGAVMGFGFTGEALRMYPLVVIRNFIMAWPLNLFIVSPLVRFILFPAIFPAKEEGKAA